MVGLYMLAIWKKAVTDWWQLFSWNKVADEVSCWGWLDFWSKASRIWEGYSKCGDWRKAVVGAKQVDIGRLLQAGRTVQGGSRSKASRFGKVASSVEIGEKLELEQSKLI